MTIRIQGMLDNGPAEPTKEFLPHRKAIPQLVKVADGLNSTLIPMLMGWEKPGPWIYPESFPSAGGEESVREFNSMARERGWHTGLCSNDLWAAELKCK